MNGKGMFSVRPVYRLNGPADDAVYAAQAASALSRGQQPPQPQNAAQAAAAAQLAANYAAQGVQFAPVMTRTARENVQAAVQVAGDTVIKQALIKRLREKGAAENAIRAINAVPDGELAKFAMIAGRLTKEQALAKSSAQPPPSLLKKSKATLYGPEAAPLPSSTFSLPAGGIPAALDLGTIGAAAMAVPPVGAALGLLQAAPQVIGQVGDAVKGVTETVGQIAPLAKGAVSAVVDTIGGIYSEIGKALDGVRSFVADLFGDSPAQAAVKNAIAAFYVQQAIVTAQRAFAAAGDQVAAQVLAGRGIPQVAPAPAQAAPSAMAEVSPLWAPFPPGVRAEALELARAIRAGQLDPSAVFPKSEQHARALELALHGPEASARSAEGSKGHPLSLRP